MDSFISPEGLNACLLGKLDASKIDHLDASVSVDVKISAMRKASAIKIVHNNESLPENLSLPAGSLLQGLAFQILDENDIIMYVISMS